MGAPDLEDRPADRPADPPAEQAGGGSERPARRLDPRIVLGLLAILAIAGAAALLIAGAGGGTRARSGAAHGGGSGSFAGLTFSPRQPVPPLRLHNHLGRPFDIAGYRGRALLVTFVYTHCPDVCPLIVSNLRVAQNLMGSRVAARVQIVAVSVDARGDNRETVTAFLKGHEMTGRMQYLIGSQGELARVWEAWKVGSVRDVHNPALVEHSGLVYGISASGRVTTLYAANFKPSEIAHDVPLLASE